jgi:hypothetical protein
MADRADERHMGERLREIPELIARFGLKLLCK